MLLLCAICTELMNEDDYICATTCGHIYHHQCLTPWVRSSQNCPQCREPVSESSMLRMFPTSGASAAATSGVSGNGHDTTVLEEEHESLKVSIESMKQLLASVQEELSVRNNDIVLLQAQLQSMEETNQRENMTLIEALKRNACNSKNELENAKQKITNLEQQLNTSKTESMALKYENLDLTNRLKQTERNEINFKTKLENATQKIINLEQQLDTSKTESMGVKKENLDLTNRLNQTEKYFRDLSSAKNELECSRRTVIDLEQHLDGSKKKINKLREGNQHLSKRLQGFANAIRVTAVYRQVDSSFITYDYQEKLALNIVERLARVLASLRAELIAENSEVVIRLDRALLKPMEEIRMRTGEWKSCWWDWLRTPYEAPPSYTRSSCPNTPEAVPTASEVVPTVPKAMPSISEVILDAFEAVPMSSETVPTSTEEVPIVPEAMPSISEAIPDSFKVVPTASEAVPTVPEAIPTAPEAVRTVPGALLTAPTAVPIAPGAMPTTSKAIPIALKAVPATPEAMPSTSKGIPIALEAMATSSVPNPRPRSIHVQRENHTTAVETTQVVVPTTSTLVTVRHAEVTVKPTEVTFRPTELTVRHAEVPMSPVPTPRPRSILVKRKNYHNTVLVDEAVARRFSALDIPNNPPVNVNELRVPAISIEKSPASVVVPRPRSIEAQLEEHIGAVETSPEAVSTAPDPVPTAPEPAPTAPKPLQTALDASDLM